MMTHTRNWWKKKGKPGWQRPLLFLTIILALVWLSGLLPNPRPVSAQSGTTITLTSAATTINGCETLDVFIRINAVTGLYGADVLLTFDPAVLEVTALQESVDFLQPPFFITRKQYDNTAGTIRLALTQLNPTLPVSGSGNFGRVTFRAKGTQTNSPVQFVYSELANINGVTIPATAVNGSLSTVPLPPTTLSISRLNATTARLSWLSVVGADRYDLYRSTDPYFTPTGLPYQSLTTTTFDDIGVLGNSTNYFYALKAACNNSFSSNESTHVGEIDYSLNNSGGQYSMIAVPFVDPSIALASDLANHIGNVGALLKWEPSTQLFRFFVPPNNGNNFSISTGDAIYVVVNNGGLSTTSMLGDVTSVQFSLTPGEYNFISLPLNRTDLTDAQAAAADITHVNAMLYWNQNTQLFRFFAPPNSGNNFSLRVGDPFIVSLDATGPTEWP